MLNLCYECRIHMGISKVKLWLFLEFNISLFRLTDPVFLFPQNVCYNNLPILMIKLYYPKLADG